MFFEFPPKHAAIFDEQITLQAGKSVERTWFQWFQRLRDNLDGGNHTATNLAAGNIVAVAIQPARFLRVGDAVSVYGAFQYQNVAAGVLSFIELSVPIQPNLTGAFDLAGVGTSVDAAVTEDARVFGVVPNVARVEWIAIAAGAPRSMFYTYAYRVV